MNNTNNTVSLINPFSKISVEKPVAEIISGGLDRFAWPDEVTEQLNGMVESDEEYVTKAVEIMGAERAGEVILGA